MTMNRDFRVSVTLATHPKTKKLMRQLGDRAFYNLIRFWTFVAQNSPDGCLDGYDIDDIEIAADWQGEPGVFFQALVDRRFIDETDAGYQVHDWEEHNGYAAHAKERSKKATKAAAARWGKPEKKNETEGLMLNDAKSNAPSIKEHSGQHASSNAPSPAPTPTPAPTPAPAPSPNELAKTDKRKSPSKNAPDIFPITQQMKTYAEKKNYAGDLENLTERFLIHHRSKGSKFSNWYSAWQNWLLNEIKWRGTGGTQPTSEPPSEPYAGMTLEDILS